MPPPSPHPPATKPRTFSKRNKGLTAVWELGNLQVDGAEDSIVVDFGDRAHPDTALLLHSFVLSSPSPLPTLTLSVAVSWKGPASQPGGWSFWKKKFCRCSQITWQKRSLSVQLSLVSLCLCLFPLPTSPGLHVYH